MAIAVGCFNRPWSTLTLAETFRHIAAAGYTHAGLLRQSRELVIAPETPSARVDEIGTMATEEGLSLDVLMTPVPLDQPKGKVLAALLEQAEHAARVGAQYLLTMGAKEEQDYDAWCALIREAAPAVAERGALLTVKPHGGITMTGAHCANVVRAVNSPHFGIFYDPGNVAYYTGAWSIDDVKDVAEHVVGVCVKGVRLDGPKPVMDVVAGDGVIDYHATFDILRQAGFDGAVVVETTGGADPDDVDARATRTREMLRAILGA